MGNPCGANARCRDLVGTYECKCDSGCTGNPRTGCKRPISPIDGCQFKICGPNAKCKSENGVGKCYCPTSYPHGDPNKSCASTPGDKECQSDSDCTIDKSCIRGNCKDPCSLRGACGNNAICEVINHRPRCTCPECYTGSPFLRCKLNPSCRSP